MCSAKKHLDPDSELIVLENMEDMESMRPVWEKLQSHPNADMDYFRTVIEARPEIIRPLVICIKKQSKAAALIAGRIEDIRLECKFGYKTIYRPKVRALSVVYGGIMGDMSDENSQILISELIGCLKRGEADLIYLSNLKTGTKIYEKAIQLPGFLCRDYNALPNYHWRIQLPSSLEEYYQSVKYKVRKNLRRTAKLLSDKYSDQVIVKCFRGLQELNQFIEHAEAIAKKTYQRGLGVGFADDYENRRLLTLAAKRGWFRSYVLYVGEKPISFDAAVHYGNTLYLLHGAYDPDYKQFEPGTNLFLKYLEELCKDPEVSSIDFGFGDAVYKQHLCNDVWEEAPVYIFASNIRGIKLNLLRSVIAALHHYGGKTLKRTRMYQDIKRKWRERIRRRND
jgi:hypothetical protein